jgi:group I intron endonuclease
VLDFTFVVVELFKVDPKVSKTYRARLLDLEQKYLKWVFTLPANLCYNFARIAEAPFTGLTHTPETRAKISEAQTGKTRTPETRAKLSEAQTGALNSMFGKTPSPESLALMSDAKTGANNPIFGKIPANAMTINVYSIDNVLVHSFSSLSQVAVAKWLGINQSTVSRCIKSSKVWNKLYTFRKSSS